MRTNRNNEFEHGKDIAVNRLLLATGIVACFSLGVGCKRDSVEQENSPAPENASNGDHAHAEGADDDPGRQASGHHDEVSIGSVAIGDLTVAFAQGHGKVEPGREGHLVVKLPYNDKGATTVRAWLGTEDRTASFVGKGQYAPSHDDYDVHAIAPDPLPENVMWWIEIEKPDGKKVVGSIKPLLK